MYGADRNSGALGEALRYAAESNLFPRLLWQRGLSEKDRHFITKNGGIGEKLMPLLHKKRRYRD